MGPHSQQEKIVPQPLVLNRTLVPVVPAVKQPPPQRVILIVDSVVQRVPRQTETNIVRRLLATVMTLVQRELVVAPYQPNRVLKVRVRLRANWVRRIRVDIIVQMRHVLLLILHLPVTVVKTRQTNRAMMVREEEALPVGPASWTQVAKIALLPRVVLLILHIQATVVKMPL